MCTFCAILLIIILLNARGGGVKIKPFGKDKTNLLKIVLPFLVIIQHCHVYDDFELAGTMAVTVYFFISGYGMENKREQGGLNMNMLGSSLLKLLLPILFPALTYVLIKYFYLKQDWSYIYSEFFIKSQIILPFTWFVRTLLVLYVLFTILSIYIKERWTLFCFVIVFSMFAGPIGLIPTYTSPIGFVIGILFKYYERNVINALNKHHNILVIILITFIIVTFTTLWLHETRSQYYIIRALSRLIPSAIYPLCVILLISYLPKFSDKLNMSRFSYDFYLCQGIAFLLITKDNFYMDVFYVLASILTTTWIAIICHKFTNNLKKLITHS